MTRTVINPRQGSKYASSSGYVSVLIILGYIIYVTASGIFKTLNYLEHFLFWHIKIYLGIFRHCLAYWDIFVTVCNLDILITLTSSEAFLAKSFKYLRIYQLPFSYFLLDNVTSNPINWFYQLLATILQSNIHCVLLWDTAIRHFH